MTFQGSLFPASVLAAALSFAHAAPVTFQDNTLSNGIVSVAFAEDGTFTISDRKNGDALLADSRFALPWARPDKVQAITAENLKDELGEGKRVTIEVRETGEMRYRNGATQLFTYTLYQDHPALVCGFGLKTPNYLSLRMHEARPVAGGTLFGGSEIKAPMTLNGGAGATRTSVEPGLNRDSANALMLTGIVNGDRRTAVWGGLRYREFGAYATLTEGSPSFYSEDPVGRLVDENQTWIAHDTLYLDVHTREPFEALERYGLAMRAANKAKPNVYDFPVLCGWSVGALSKLPNVNNSPKLIEELGHATKSGITKYTPVSLRFEPDKYHFDTEQGWWDDERFRQYKHLLEPYDTMAKWCAKMRDGGGIPYTYMQLGMPSDDFARAHPTWMLFNHADDVDKMTPGLNRKHKGQPLKHRHHQPYVTYDYTDKEFQAHFLKAWKKIANDGVRGVKVDYPATAWRPEGGFDDRSITASAAYRIPFQLLREAFGANGFIDERNLGASSRPCLEVTAGIVDTQRNWIDSKDYVPGMINIGGLRWYKNRTVFNYYPDTKTVHDLDPAVRKSMLTMVFLTSGRLDLASSFSLFTLEITRDISRIYPHYPEAKSARPLDAFTGVVDPQVYDLELTPDWHQITFYNTGKESTEISTAISGERVGNAIDLDPKGEYHAYEFWTDSYLGKLSGTGQLSRTLEPNHCAMISLRKAQSNPQVISTDRHLLQGWVDLENVTWDAAAKTLKGTAKVIGGDPFKITIASNGLTAKVGKATGASAETSKNGELDTLTLKSDTSGDVAWEVGYQ